MNASAFTLRAAFGSLSRSARLVNVPEDVLRVQVGVLEGDGGDEIDEAAEIRRVDLELGVGLVEDALELRVLLFDGIERVVDELAGGGDLVGAGLAVLDGDLRAGRELGAILQRLPPGECGDPEDVLLDVVVALFQLAPDGFEVFGAAFAVVISRIEKVVALVVAELRLDLRLPDGERVGDVFEEDEAEDRVLINGGVEIGAEAVGGHPKLFVEVAEEGL